VLIGGGFVWLAWLCIAKVNSGKSWREHAGLLGDSFGIVNALFTMIAMVGAWYTVYLQWCEIERHEQSADADQREKRFFQLVTLLGQSMQSAQFESPIHLGVVSSGYQAFDNAMNSYRMQKTVGNRQHLLQNELKDQFSQWADTAEAIVEFIENTTLAEQRNFFSRILRSQFSASQRQLISLLRPAQEASLRNTGIFAMMAGAYEIP
jgi:hypothetical protein